MPGCNCNATCSCKFADSETVTFSGSGTANDPITAEATGGGEGTSGWLAGDLKDTWRTDTPAGWLEANGQAVSRAAYATLFGAIGTTAGAGNGTTTFNVPTFAGRVRIGAGGDFDQFDSGGNAETTLSIANLPPHTHNMAHIHAINHDHPSTFTSYDGDHHHDPLRIKTTNIGATEVGNNNNSVSRGPDAGANTAAPLDWTQDSGQHRHSLNLPSFVGNSGGSSATNTGSTGSATPFSNLPPYRVVRVLVKT